MGHFGDKSFQAIDCTGIDNQKQSNTTNTTYTRNTKDRQKKNNSLLFIMLLYGSFINSLMFKYKRVELCWVDRMMDWIALLLKYGTTSMSRIDSIASDGNRSTHDGGLSLLKKIDKKGHVSHQTYVCHWINK